jgi:hypothetical protein
MHQEAIAFRREFHNVRQRQVGQICLSTVLDANMVNPRRQRQSDDA